MSRYQEILPAAITFLLSFSSHVVAEQPEWGDLQGQIIFKASVPPRERLPFDKNPDAKACAMDKDPRTEDWIVHAENRGLKNVVVWIRPVGIAKDAAFPQEKIHPTQRIPLAKVVQFEIVGCRLVPHVLAARAGQKLVIKNNSTVAHQIELDPLVRVLPAPLIEPGKKLAYDKPLAEPAAIALLCTIHPWMIAHLRVFDHPYFAITDENGKFEIKSAPVGKVSIWYWHPRNGWLGGVKGKNGYPLTIVTGKNDLGKVEMMLNGN